MRRGCVFAYEAPTQPRFTLSALGDQRRSHNFHELPLTWSESYASVSFKYRFRRSTAPLPLICIGPRTCPGRSRVIGIVVFDNLSCCQQWDNRPICVYANNCTSPDLVRVRGVLYYSSAGFFLLQLEQACSYLPSVCGPADQRGDSCRVGRRQSLRMGHRIVESMVGRSAPRQAEAGILIGTHNVTGR